MRRIVTTALATVTVLVLLFSYHTSTDSSLSAASVVAGPPRAGGTRTHTPSAPATPSGPSAAGTPAAPAAPKAGSGTFTGDAAWTAWGPVQVRITVANGKLTDSQAVQFPSGNGRDAEINAVAVPILNQEAVSAQSADIDTVSGATITSDGYLESLQSALDQAHL